MGYVPLADFVETNRQELIRRCELKVSERTGAAPAARQISEGVPVFLRQLVEELRNGQSKVREITISAKRHGKELLLGGFTIAQVVHGYGDVCQSVTDMAVDRAAPIAPDEFRTLNRCLDDAIAGAVTEYARHQDLSRNGESHEQEILLNTAITAFDALRTGSVGLVGTTATLVRTSLLQMRGGFERARLAQGAATSNSHRARRIDQ